MIPRIRQRISKFFFVFSFLANKQIYTTTSPPFVDTFTVLTKQLLHPTGTTYRRRDSPQIVERFFVTITVLTEKP